MRDQVMPSTDFYHTMAYRSGRFAMSEPESGSIFSLPKRKASTKSTDEPQPELEMSELIRRTEPVTPSFG